MLAVLTAFRIFKQKYLADQTAKILAAQGLDKKIVALSFDTTASNTGMVRSVCVRIDQDLGGNLLCLACRHHTHEIILKYVFEDCFGEIHLVLLFTSFTGFRKSGQRSIKQKL